MAETAKRLARKEKPAKRGAAKPGQPTKLDAAMAKKICELIARGLPLESVAERCRISYQTLINYRTQPSEYLEAIRNAEAEPEDAWLRKIDGSTAWQSAAWRLKNRYRDRYGDATKVEHSGTVAWPQFNVPKGTADDF